jgi:hypothetical protein
MAYAMGSVGCNPAGIEGSCLLDGWLDEVLRIDLKPNSSGLPDLPGDGHARYFA